MSNRFFLEVCSDSILEAARLRHSAVDYTPSPATKK